MVATFTYLDGNSFSPLERRLVRGSLFILAAWHIVWFFYLGYGQYVDLKALYIGLSVLTAVALVMGLVGFALQRSRTGRFAPLRAWIPWIALPLGAMAVVTNWLGSHPGQVVGFAISAFFNIHHYFTDGVVWKLRDPAVREDLFGHLSRPARR